MFLTLFALTACRAGLPEKSSADFPKALKSFYVGLAAMQAADDLRAKKELETAVALAPQEPSAWANLGILQMRQKDFEASLKSLETARSLAPDNGQIYANLAVLENLRGNFEAVKTNLQKAIAVDSRDAKANFALAEELEREGKDGEAAARYEKIFEIYPDNPAVAVELVRLTAKLGETDKLRANFARLKPREDVWDAETKEQYNALKTSVEAGNQREVAQKINFFRNVMLRLPEFRAAIEDVKFSKTTVGLPFARPLKLPAPDFSPAAADTEIAFKPERLADEKAGFVKAVFLDGDSAPVAAFATLREIKIGAKNLPVADALDLQTVDIDYNFKNDFVTAGAKGLQFFTDEFVEITAATKLSPDVLQRKYLKIFTFDIEIDGDLDLILATPNAPTVVLQNNADGTFKELKLFAEFPDLRNFTSADFDEDGDMDAVFLSADNRLKVFSNERGGQFRPRSAPFETDVSGIAVADANGDGRLDLNVLKTDGTFWRATDRDGGRDWETAEIFKTAPMPVTTLFVEDFDNNGANDFLVAGRLRLTDKNGQTLEEKQISNGQMQSVVDLNSDGKLDFVGFEADGKPANFVNQSAKNYAWQIIRPRSAKAQGDQRVNSFGIGGEMEIRAGLLAQKRLINAPQVHFGLGEQTSTDLLRIIWGNGFIQAEFDLEKDQQILVKQRLTGSCPHLFAWNGREFKLVKDSAPLGTSLGLKISENEVLPVTQTEEWYKIAGENLAPKDGFYELRITDELWESYYVDHYSLLVVDHPENTEIFANELYPIPVPLKLHTISQTQAFASVRDEKGRDVARMVENLDEIYLDTFAEGRFQGVAEEHFAELELPTDAPNSAPISIIADGWLHPTDTSLNVAIGQSGFEKPKSLSLDVADENGVWRTVKEDFGVPAGKLKTVVIDLPTGTKRARLRTNMEIFWDKLAWSVRVPDNENIVQKLALAEAELAFRGFSVIDKKSDSAPEIPDYNRIATTIERWRSIEGYYTRYGSILELLTGVDDRYAIVGAGDEMRLKFPALAPVKAGYKRDFIIVGDGWIKEGDYNNVFSKTILPLPTRLTNDYSRPPTRLEDDPVYRRNKGDWQNFHTRYVAPDQFRNALRGR